VHNAGITRDKKLANMKEDGFASAIAVNLTAPERITTELLRQDLVNANGRIIGVASIAGIAGNLGQTNYAASKAGVIGFVDSLADDLKDGITVNAVAPGFVLTELTQNLPEALQNELIARTPLGRFGTVEEIADAVAFLVSEEARYITGQVLAVDGGLVMM
jgi:3-oxoacyl-[acyl-carrier protein] reductase